MADVALPRVRAVARAWRRLSFLTAAAAVLVLFHRAALFVLGIEVGLRHKAAPGQYHVQVSATATTAKSGKKKAAGGKYRGPVNPSLRMLL